MQITDYYSLFPIQISLFEFKYILELNMGKNLLDQKQKECYIYALKLLSRREYSEKMMEEKLLSKNFDQKIVGKIIKILNSEDYLDNKRFIKSYIRTTLSYKNIGPYKILNYLRTKGIKDNQFWEIWETLDIDEKKIAKKALKYKINRLKNKMVDKKTPKLYQFLLSRGFSKNIINNLLKTHDLF